MADKVNWSTILTIGALVAAIVLGGASACSRYGRAASLEISLTERPQQEGVIHMGEGFAAPGAYPFTQSDTLADLLAAAGGLKNGVSAADLNLEVISPDATGQPQKIDINRAEPWLLEALPGVGAVLAQRIVDYRRQNGPFRTTSDITEVSGIGTGLYERIKDMIAVSDG